MKKKYFFITVIMFCIIFFSFIIIIKKNNSNDGMENTGIKTVYYYVFSNGSWSKKSKNGITSGNKKNQIKNIDIKLGLFEKEHITYSFYDGKKWNDFIEDEKKSKKYNIYGFRMSGTQKLTTRYDICYRTYNLKTKWLRWSCNYVPNGLENNPITAIEIKIIPKNVIKNSYLKDYNNIQKSPNIDTK